MYLLGFDIGSSSVKVSLVDGEKGKTVASSYSPKQEMKMQAQQPGWAEQHPDLWWDNLKTALMEVMATSGVEKEKIAAIGISYQMHGLVLVDKNGQVLRPSIIWCDSRAVEIGNKAFQAIGEKECLGHMLNSPGNFTASKLKWVKENEPDLYGKTYKIMLPGDYIAYRLTGNLQTTVSGLSEGIFWDFKNNNLSESILSQYGFDKSLFPELVPTFSNQGTLLPEIAKELGLSAQTAVAYRAGDQPNNAFSLNVLQPGEIAATAGTSGVVYGVSDVVKYDPLSRVNTFAHVNHNTQNTRLGVLLCVNGTGILNSWAKHNFACGMDYPEMNQMAQKIKIGSEGLAILPFGNGAERMLGNINPGASFHGMNFNMHNQSHIFRAVQEGIVFSLTYGIDVMGQTGIKPSVIRAGKANMFLSPIFRDTLAATTGASIELYETDGSQGAAKGAGMGIGYYKWASEAFATLKKAETIEPPKGSVGEYTNAYQNWKKQLNQIFNQ
jgi:xylulokinase